jgi:hypothetical protein
MIMTGPYFGNGISRIADTHFTFVFSGLSTYGVAKGGWDGCVLWDMDFMFAPMQ